MGIKEEISDVKKIISLSFRFFSYWVVSNIVIEFFLARINLNLSLCLGLKNLISIESFVLLFLDIFIKIRKFL